MELGSNLRIAGYGSLVPEPTTGLHIDERLQAAIAASHLCALPPDVITRLLTTALRFTVAAGHTLHRVGDDDRHVELVVTGLVRVQVSAPDGRPLTVRYCVAAHSWESCRCTQNRSSCR